MKKTVVLGASDNPSRYSYKAIHRLQQHGYEVVPVGIKNSTVGGLPIITDKTQKVDNVDTVTLYVGPQNQPVWYDYIISLNPKRIIFLTPAPKTGNWSSWLKITASKQCTIVRW